MVDPRPRGLDTPRDLYPVGRPISTVEILTVSTIAIAALYFAREVFVPLALAVLLSFALGPLVMRLRRWHLGRVPSVVMAVLLAFAVIFGLASVIGSQLAQLAENLPKYQSNVIEKIHSLQGSATQNGVVERASAMLKSLSSEIASPAPPPESTPASEPAPAAQSDQPRPPIPVEIHQPAPTPMQIIEAVVGPLVQPLASAGIVAVFVIFFLLQREDLRDRFIRLAGARDLQRTTQGLNDAGRRLSRYLLAQTAINTAFGTLIGLGLWIIGVPDAMLWGIFAMLLRFVPYIGAVIAAIFPATLALAVDPGWTMLAWTCALFAVVEPITGQIVEPLLYGRSTGLSAVAVVVAAAFWTWLWGPIGLLLSTPLTLCLVVLGRHVERLEFLDIILGDQPALTLEENFYQRMLANNPDEAAHKAEEFLKAKPLSAYYDEVAIRGLALAQLDVNRGVLDHDRRIMIKEAILGVIDDLSDHAGPIRMVEAAPAGAAPSSEETSSEAVTQAWHGKSVMCIAGRGSLDEAAAAMLGQLLENRGVVVRVVSSDAVTAANIFRLETADVKLICLSYLEPGGFTNARYLVRRLRRKLPGVPILVGFWTLSEEDAAARDAQAETGADGIFTSLQHATEHIALARRNVSRGEEPGGPASKVPPAAA